MSDHFESLTLFGCPPVGNQHYEFTRDINFLVGGNGTGKTSMAMALRDGLWPYGGGVQLSDPKVSEVIKSNWSLSYSNDTCGHISSPIAPDHWVSACAAEHELQKKMGALVSEMISGKLGVAVTKFHSVPFVGEDTFEITIDSKGDIRVGAGPALRSTEHYSPYGSINSLFQAASERALIGLVGLLVVREKRKLNSPLILDGIFSNGTDFAGSILRQLRTLECQVIVLETERSMDRLRDHGHIQVDDHIQSLCG